MPPFSRADASEEEGAAEEFVVAYVELGENPFLDSGDGAEAGEGHDGKGFVIGGCGAEGAGSEGGAVGVRVRRGGGD